MKDVQKQVQLLRDALNSYVRQFPKAYASPGKNRKFVVDSFVEPKNNLSAKEKVRALSIRIGHLDANKSQTSFKSSRNSAATPS